jgi:hypothetical protein
MAEIRFKTVEYAQLNFRHRFWWNQRQNWPKLFQPGRIYPKSAHVKPITGRISTELEEIRPKSVAEIKLRVFNRFYTNFNHFGRKRNYCVEKKNSDHAQI